MTSSLQFLALVEREGCAAPLFAGLYSEEALAWLAAETVAEDFDVVRVCRRLDGQWTSRRGWSSLAWSPPTQRQADAWECCYRGENSATEREMIVSLNNADSLLRLASMRGCTTDDALAHAIRLAMDCERAFLNGHRPVIERGPGITQPLHGWEQNQRSNLPAPSPAESPRIQHVPEWALDNGPVDQIEIAKLEQTPEVSEPPGDRAKCRSCNQPIWFRPTRTGKQAPWNADGTSHFATCPNATSHRRPRR